MRKRDLLNFFRRHQSFLLVFPEEIHWTDMVIYVKNDPNIEKLITLEESKKLKPNNPYNIYVHNNKLELSENDYLDAERLRSYIDEILSTDARKHIKLFLPDSVGVKTVLVEGTEAYSLFLDDRRAILVEKEHMDYLRRLEPADDFYYIESKETIRSQSSQALVKPLSYGARIDMEIKPLADLV